MGEPLRPAYAPSKAGINALTRHVASRLGNEGIRCNGVAPGMLLSETGLETMSEEFRAAGLATTRSTRLGRPADLAATIAFLLSEDAAWVNGQTWAVDGGSALRDCTFDFVKSGVLDGTMMSTLRQTRGSRTRELILDAAERLFAEHGIAAVSGRQIGEAAGQGNNSAVGYHFGTKTDLVRAIVRRHTDAMERRRAELIAETGDSTELRDWVACLVRPATDHLAGLPAPTWYARFIAQADADPTLREVVIEEVVATPAMRQVLDGLARLRPHLPEPVRLERGGMARILIVHVLAERERALQDGADTAEQSWDEAADALIAAICGLWQAPASTDG